MDFIYDEGRMQNPVCRWADVEITSGLYSWAGVGRTLEGGMGGSGIPAC